ncbi:hypothetical protein KJA15_00950 [Patescibacteria group bacterium]|nr:hypothetical protein [Patescibacteria group bacterium]
MRTETKIIIGLLVIAISISGFLIWLTYQVSGNVLVTTDKTEYEKGEVLKVKIQNNFRKNVCFSSCYPYLLERKNEKWESYKYAECYDLDSNGKCISPGQIKAFELTLPQVPGGLHRLAIPVCIGCKGEDTFKESKRFYSNEFIIK